MINALELLQPPVARQPQPGVPRSLRLAERLYMTAPGTRQLIYPPFLPLIKSRETSRRGAWDPCALIPVIAFSENVLAIILLLQAMKGHPS